MAVGTSPRRHFGSDGWRHDNPFMSVKQSVGRLRRRAVSQSIRQVIADHWMTVTAIGFISAAFFQLDTFWGLLVTGLLIFLFELKVGES